MRVETVCEVTSVEAVGMSVSRLLHAVGTATSHQQSITHSAEYENVGILARCCHDIHANHHKLMMINQSINQEIVDVAKIARSHH